MSRKIRSGFLSEPSLVNGYFCPLMSIVIPVNLRNGDHSGS